MSVPAARGPSGHTAPGGPGDHPGDLRAGSLACVVLAHDDLEHVRRLIGALHPFPVFLHCDARTAPRVFAAMTRDLPDRVTVLPRRATPWARWGAVAAELDGYRAALATTGASHVALLSGSDYPLASAGAIAAALAQHPGRSVAESRALPIADWHHDGGYWRVRFRFLAWRKHLIVASLPRRLPRQVVLAGGSALKVLARDHVAALLGAVDRHPELVRRWRHTWSPDETFVHSVLNTPALVPGWSAQHTAGSAWYIGWDGTARKSPPWLTSSDLPAIHQHLAGLPSTGAPLLFARKFSTRVDTAVLDEIDRTLREDARLVGPVGS